MSEHVSGLLHAYVRCVKKTGNFESNSVTRLGALVRFEVARLLDDFHADHHLVRPVAVCEESFEGRAEEQEARVDSFWGLDRIRGIVSGTFSDLLLCAAAKDDAGQRIFEYDNSHVESPNCCCLRGIWSWNVGVVV